MSRLNAFAVSAVVLALSQTAAIAEDQPQSLRTEPLELVTKSGVKHVTVEVADHEQQREIGLMYRRSLADDHGMLFEFNAVEPVSFWMKNTYIPLDIVFIAPSGKVVSIARKATPMSEAAIPSGGPVDAVLELRGGRAAEIGLEPGDTVRAKFFHN